MEEYRNMRDFMRNISDFHWEMKNLYTEITKELATPNAWSRREVSFRFQMWTEGINIVNRIPPELSKSIATKP